MSAAAIIERQVVPERRYAAGFSFLQHGRAADPLPLLLLHGIGSNASSFTPLMRALGDLYASIAWDAPGYGESDHLEAEWPSAAHYAEALDRLLQRLAIQRAVLLGHSLGALIAARFAVQYPAKVAGLMLVSPAAGYASPPHEPLPPAVHGRLEELKQLGPASFAAKRAPRLLSQPETMPDIRATVEQAMASIDVAGYAQAARMLATGAIVEDVSRLSVPTLVVCGAHDVITPPEQAQRIAAAIAPDAKAGEAIIVANAGHALPQEQPEYLAALIRDFVGRLPARRPA